MTDLGHWRTGEVDAKRMLDTREMLISWAVGSPELIRKRMKWTLCPPGRAALLSAQLGEWLVKSECLLWETEIWEAALRGAEAFSGAEFSGSMLPKNPVLFFVPGQINAGTQALFEVDTSSECNIVLLSPVRGAPSGRLGLGLTFVFWPVIPEEEYTTVKRQDAERWFPYFRAFPSLYVGDKIPDKQYSSMAALVSFLSQPFVTSQPMVPFSRQQRRHYERKKGPLPDIRVVTLRRSQRQEIDGSTEGSREWSCKWLVGSHWRRRSERQTKGSGPIYVSPYLKGPMDKPFRAPRQTVFKVTR